MNSFQAWAKHVAEARGCTVEPVGNRVRLTRAGVSVDLFTEAGVRALLGIPTPPRVRVVCAECGAENVLRDAYARWDEAAQEWSMSSTQDYTCCDDCGAEDCAKEVPL